MLNSVVVLQVSLNRNKLFCDIFTCGNSGPTNMPSPFPILFPPTFLLSSVHPRAFVRPPVYSFAINLSAPKALTPAMCSVNKKVIIVQFNVDQALIIFSNWCKMQQMIISKEKQKLCLQHFASIPAHLMIICNTYNIKYFKTWFPLRHPVCSFPRRYFCQGSGMGLRAKS